MRPAAPAEGGLMRALVLLIAAASFALALWVSSTWLTETMAGAWPL